MNRRQRAHRARRPSVRAGMTLLEVILSIAILGGSLAVLGELARVGTRAAKTAQVLSTAQMLADSVAAEITAGITLPEPTEGVLDDYGGMSWAYFVQVEQVDQEGLLAVMVTVQETVNTVQQQPVTFSLVRWMIDPQLEEDLELAEEQMAAESASGSGSSSTDSGSGSSGDSGSGGAAPEGGGR